MKKVLLILLATFISSTSVFAYAIKVYDEMGNRIGTYRKEGENFVLYDFNDEKVEDPTTIMKAVPSKRTLTNCTQYFYDENMQPITVYPYGYYTGNRKFLNSGYRYPRSWYPYSNNNSIVVPAVGDGFTIKTSF